MLNHPAADPAGPYVRHTPYRGVELTDKGRAVEACRERRTAVQWMLQALRNEDNDGAEDGKTTLRNDDSTSALRNDLAWPSRTWRSVT